jgi:hypothetical protein
VGGNQAMAGVASNYANKSPTSLPVLGDQIDLHPFNGNQVLSVLNSRSDRDRAVQ